MDFYTRDEVLGIAQTLGLLLVASAFATWGRGSLAPLPEQGARRPRRGLRRLADRARRERWVQHFVVYSHLLTLVTIVYCLMHVSVAEPPQWFTSLIRLQMVLCVPGLAFAFTMELARHWVRPDTRESD